MTSTEPRSLFRHRDFMHLWTAETISQLGSQVTVLAIPLAAIITLHATTFQVGLLTAVEFSPFVIFGLPAGAIVDRLRRRPVLVFCDIGRAVALASIPIAYAFDVLSYAQLLVVVFLTGSMTVFFDVAYQSILPSIVGREQLADGNAKLEISRSAAQLAGPALGGFLIQWFRAAFAIVADAVSFLFSGFFIFGIRAKEPPAATADETAGRLRTLAREVKEGLHYVLGDRVLRLVAGSTATANLFGSMMLAVFLVYAKRELGYSAGAIGLIFALGNVGVLVAALLAQRITARIRLGPAILIGMTVGQLGMLIIPLAPTTHAYAWFVGAFVLFGFGGTLYNIDQVSLRQAITPDRMQGRMNASMRFMVWGTMPIGALLGGILGTALGLRQTLLVAGIGALVAIPWLILRQVLELKEIPAIDHA
jgi:MFS family permease